MTQTTTARVTEVRNTQQTVRLGATVGGYAVEATAEVVNGRLGGMYDGGVTAATGEGAQLCGFRCDGDGRLVTDFYAKEGRGAILGAVEDFVAAARVRVESGNGADSVLKADTND